MRIAFLAVLLGISFGQTPKWYINNQLSGYPSSQYFTGVGEGPTFEDAQSIAQAAIGAQLRVAVESTVETFVQEMDSDDKSEYLEVFNKATRSTVDETITGIEVVKQKKVKKIFYVFAALNKDQFLSGVKVELDQLWGKTSKLIQDARNYANQGKIFVALENYTDAQEFVVPFYTQKAFYDALSPTPYITGETVTVSQLTSEIRGILSGVNIRVITGDNQSAKAGTELESPISFYTYYQKGGSGKEIPIPNMPLIIKYEDGTIVERVSTDQDGNVETHVTAFPFSGNHGKVFARPNLVRLPDLYKKYLKNAEGVMSYSLLGGSALSFSIVIKDERGKRLPKVEGKLAKSIQKLGYVISDNAELSLKGTVEKVTEKEIEGKSGTQYMVTSELSVFVVVKSTGDQIASYSGTGKGLSSKNVQKALVASYKKLNIKKKDLAGMLSKAEEHRE